MSLKDQYKLLILGYYGVVSLDEYDLKVYVVDFNSNSCNPYNETDLTKSKYYLMNNNKEIINIITFDSDCSVTLRLEQGIYYLQQQRK